MPTGGANLRLLQGVEPSSAGRRVHSRILASSAGLRCSTAGPVGVHARQPLSFATPLPPTAIVGVAAQNPANRPVGFSLRQTTRSAAPGVHLRPATCANAAALSVPCARSASSETLLHACFMIHERNTNVSQATSAVGSAAADGRDEKDLARIPGAVEQTASAHLAVDRNRDRRFHCAVLD